MRQACRQDNECKDNFGGENILESVLVEDSGDKRITLKCWTWNELILNGAQWLISVLLMFVSYEYTGWTTKLTTPLHLVPSLRLHGAIPPIPHTPSLRDVQGRQDFTLTLRVATTHMFKVNKMKANKISSKHSERLVNDR